MLEIELNDLRSREALCKFFIQVLLKEGDRSNPLWGPAVDEYQRQLLEIQAKIQGKPAPTFVKLKPATITSTAPPPIGD